MANDPALASRFLADTTVHTFDAYHHNQYEYLAADGSTALLYPGNSAPVPGHWQIQGAGEWNAKICFRYGANTWNPVTHQGSDGRDCQSFIGYIYDEVAEIYDGNIFGTRRIGVFARPFPRWPEFVPIRKAVSETGQPIPKGQDKALSKAGK